MFLPLGVFKKKPIHADITQGGGKRISYTKKTKNLTLVKTRQGEGGEGGGGGVLPSRLISNGDVLCCWVGLHFHCWIALIID